MGYKAANDVLPATLLQLVQEYVDGEYLYIPRKEGCQRSWGEATTSRQVIRRRNEEIRRRHQVGVPVRQLADAYYLSPKTVYKIVTGYNQE